MIYDDIAALAEYGVEHGLIDEYDRVWAINGLIDALGLDEFEMPESVNADSLENILTRLTDDAAARGVINDDNVSRDLLDTRLMGVLTPRPHEVIEKFNALYAQDPVKATDWYYEFSQDTDYIRRYRIAKDMRWTVDTEYGTLDVSINLSKPEKDPRAIAAAKNAPQSGYPKCALCRESEGYAGRMNFPARENHRIIPIGLAGESWYLQYSPYVYYNEHCIVLNAKHTPMRIDRAAFAKLLEFTEKFPHYMLGSNADLPIVGGSILSHDHFQGGRYEFAMAKAPIERAVTFRGFEDVDAGIVRWPMSVIRLRCRDKERLVDLADRILKAWRGYSDASAGILAETDGVPHNTITPIARRRGEAFELDLVLRNNLTTDEHPLGVFHPHAKLHHIKRENIGLIEVMGLAILPARLKTELARLAELLVSGGDLYADELTAKHAPWAQELKARYTFTEENVWDILKREVGEVYKQVLEDAGVYKRTPEGQEAFTRFIESVWDSTDVVFTRPKDRRGSAYYEFQYCKTDGSVRTIMKSHGSWLDDSLLIYMDDDTKFFEQYGEYLQKPISPNGSHTFDYAGINYYAPEMARMIIERIKAAQPENCDELLAWLDPAASEYNGFFFLGI